VTFGLSRDYERRTGGYVYDVRLCREFVRLGHEVDWQWLPSGFPQPDRLACEATERYLATLPDGAIFMTDQLVSSALPDVIARHARRLRIVQIVHHPLALEHGTAEDLALARAADERRALRHASLVICTSTMTAELLERDYAVSRPRLLVAPPGTTPAPPAKGGPGPLVDLLAVGAVVPRKGHDRLVEALGLLAGRPWRLRIVGNLTRAPAHVQVVRDLIARHEIQDRVELLGELDEPALADAWSVTDLFVSASHLEGHGMALAEAEAHGLPILATAAGAPARWLDPEAALVVATSSPACLAPALAALIDDPERRLRMRAAAIRSSLCRPGWQDCARAVEAALHAMQPALAAHTQPSVQSLHGATGSS
jgi:glycosyltransferase involved in cell wall biosynthesis